MKKEENKSQWKSLVKTSPRKLRNERERKKTEMIKKR